MWNCARLLTLERRAGDSIFRFLRFNSIFVHRIYQTLLIRHRALHAPDSTFKMHYIFRLNKKWMAYTHPPNSQKPPICYISFPCSHNVPLKKYIKKKKDFFFLFFPSLFTLPRSTYSPNASIGSTWPTRILSISNALCWQRVHITCSRCFADASDK